MSDARLPGRSIRPVHARLVVTTAATALCWLLAGCDQLPGAAKSGPIEPGGVKVQGAFVGENLKASNVIPLRTTFQTDDIKGLTADDKRRLVDGEAKFRTNEIKGDLADRNLQIRQIAVPDDMAIVQVVVDASNKKWGLLSDAAFGYDLDSGPVLVDDADARYPAYGFFYRNDRETWLTLRPDRPIEKMRDLPVLSASKPEDRLILFFRVGKNVKLRYFAIGNKPLLNIEPPYRVPATPVR